MTPLLIATDGYLTGTGIQPISIATSGYIAVVVPEVFGGFFYSENRPKRKILSESEKRIRDEEDIFMITTLFITVINQGKQNG